MWTSPSSVRHSVLGDLVRMQRQMDRLAGQVDGGYRSRVFPPINIYDAEDGYHLRAELPGIDPDSLDISVTRNEVVIKGDRPASEVGDDQRARRREREYGGFSRAFALPENIDTARVTATYQDGILDLRIARLPEEGPRKVQVESHRGGQDHD